MRMQGTKQLERDTTVNAPVGTVYRLFMDNAELANWAPVVDAVIDERGGDDTGLGTTRTCAVTMNGKKGTMVERCVEAVPENRASFLVVDDSFGFNKMLTDYGFTAHFTATASHRTTVRIETFYTPGYEHSPSNAIPSPKTSAASGSRSDPYAGVALTPTWSRKTVLTGGGAAP